MVKVIFLQKTPFTFEKAINFNNLNLDYYVRKNAALCKVKFVFSGFFFAVFIESKISTVSFIPNWNEIKKFHKILYDIHSVQNRTKKL